MRVVLAGGSGSLGRKLARTFNGDDVLILTRNPQTHLPCRQIRWDGKTVEKEWAAELEGAVLINLSGEIVDRRPTEKNIRQLTSSRVDPTRALVEASKTYTPEVWIQMSTLAIYGDGGDHILTEDSAPATGPPQMAGVATAWEASFAGHQAERSVVLRAAVVLEAGTPALDRLVKVTRWGLGGRIGTGKQWFSWLHVDDFADIVERIVNDPGMRGVYHATSPNPVTNEELMGLLRKTLHRPPAPPTPTLLVKFGAMLMSTDPALALTGRRAVPSRLLAEGFDFRHPDLALALDDLLG